ncbi:MAG: inositol monophosphatase [Chloroflexi bacterium RBG_16_57_11]|nr:MAG: inositol monophosphatase [Chloroflexi bacterium RBG_16_57_11]
MPTIVVASTNPVKVRAVQNGFARMFPGQNFEISTLSVPSGVSDQPASDAETLQGALNRARNAANIHPQADYWVGVEGGNDQDEEVFTGEMFTFAWIVVLSRDRLGKGRTGAFYLPSAVSDLVRQGIELGEADDIVFGRNNSKQDNGAIGLLTGDVIDRAQLYEPAVIFALIPFKNPDLYPEL